ncbi:MAG: DUF6585 family protein [Anaerolineae bacterium]
MDLGACDIRIESKPPTGAIIGLVLSVLLCGGSLAFVTDQSRGGMAGALLVISLLLVFSSAVALVRSLRSRSVALEVREGGIVYTDEAGDPRPIPYTAIRHITHEVTRQRGRDLSCYALGTSGCYSIQLKPRAFRRTDVIAAGLALQRRYVQAISPLLMRRIAGGGDAAFGPLHLTRDALRIEGSSSVAWDELSAVKVQRGTLQIISDGTTVARYPLTDLPNAALLLELLDRRVGLTI